MKQQFANFEAQRLELYKALYEHLIQRLIALGYTVLPDRNAEAGEPPRHINPLDGIAPGDFNPQWMQYKTFKFVHKGYIITVSLHNDMWRFETKTWIPVLTRRFAYYERNYPADFKAGKYSKYKEIERCTKGTDLTVLLDRLDKLVTKGAATKKLRAAEVKAGLGATLIW